MRLPRAEVPAVLEALWKEGSAVALLDPELPEEALGRVLKRIRPARLVDELGGRSLDGDPVAPGVAAVVMTSGSTGEPRAVELSHAALEASARATIAALELTAADGWLNVLPPHHVAGLQSIVRARLQGASLEVARRATAEIVARTDATVTSLVPAQLADLLDAGAPLHRFRTILLGGAAAPLALLERASAAGARVIRTYGMTETSGGCVYDGRPLPGVEVRLASDGEVQLAGPMLFARYRGEPEHTRRALVDGWFKTADAGRFDDGGRLVVLGRRDDLINTGGEKVSPAEVAALIESHPRIARAEVVGVADRRWGERVVVAIVSEHPVTLEEVRSFVGERAERYKAPHQIVRLHRLPLLGSGKVDRRALARLAQSEAQDG